MPAWIFQGNPDTYDLDEYLRRTTDVIWSVNQKHFASEMRVGDELFLWRAGGQRKVPSGVIASGFLTSTPEIIDDDEESAGLWHVPSPGPSLRVRAHIDHVATGRRKLVERKWLLSDPILSDLRILKMANETNYWVSGHYASRLRNLVRNTGRNWNHDESLAGLWAYAHTIGDGVSRLPGSPVSVVSELIGRAVTGVYNKVMNFRALDPRDERKGLQAASHVDDGVWHEFFDSESGSLRLEDLDTQFEKLWGGTKASRPSYIHFGDAPNDDLTDLQVFSARIRKGQPAFRKNLLKAYDNHCAITGWSPETVLEAVHIVPHSKTGINALDNGLLIRADLHHLMDAGLLRFDPDTLQVQIAEELKNTEYWSLNGKRIRPRVDGSFPGRRFFRERWGSSSS